LVYWGAADKNVVKSVGIVGIGGLGTMGLKIAKAMNNRVVAISTSAAKEQMAKEKGADFFIVSKDASSMASENAKLDLIINTISAEHDASVYLPLLAQGGTLVQLGACLNPHPINQMHLITQRKSIAGCIIGGLAAHQECVDFCAEHGIAPDVQMIEAKEIAWAFKQLETVNADGVRYVIDVKKSIENKDFCAAI